MSDAQLTVIIAALGGVATAIAAAFRWAVNRLVKALDENTESNKEHAIAVTTMSVKMDRLMIWVEEHTPVRGVPITPQSPAIKKRERARTPLHGVEVDTGGYGPIRPPRDNPGKKKDGI